MVRGASRQIIVFNEQNIEWAKTKRAASKRKRRVSDLGACNRSVRALIDGDADAVLKAVAKKRPVKSKR